MAQKELVFKLKFVDENGAIVEKTAESINDITKSIEDLQKELDNTELGSEQWNELAEDLGKAENALEKTTEAINDTKNAQKSLGDQLTSAPGIVGQVSNSVKGLSKTFKALLANPVVAVIAAIVGALTLLFKAFTSTKAGGEKFDQVMAGIGAAIDVLRDRVLKVGGAIVKFFSGDFSGAADDMKEAFSGIGEEIASEFNEAMRIKAELQAITDATRELNNERARQNTEIAKAKLVINDETKSYEEREKALEDVRQAEIALAKQEEILASRRYEAIKAQNALSDSSKEALDEEAAAYQALQQAQLASLQKQKELFDQQKALRDRRRAEQKAAADKRKQELQQLADLEQQLNLDLIANADARALKELAIQERTLKEQAKNLKVSKEKEAELILKIEENTRRKRNEIAQKSLSDTLGRLDVFRQVIIDQEKATNLFFAELSESALDGIRANFDESYTELTTFNEFYTAAEGDKFLEDMERLRSKNRAVQNYLALEETLTESAIVAIQEKYAKYYDTLRFEEEERYKAQLLNEEQIAAERKRQITDALRLERLKNAEVDRLLEKGVISEEEANKRKEDNKQESMTREAEINEYFNNYFENQEILHNERLNKIDEEQQKKNTEINQKGFEAREKIRQAENAAEIERVRLREDAFNAIISLVGEETALGKALAIAQTTISTYEAAQQAYASQMLIPTPDAPIRAGVAAGIAVAQGLARVLQITNVNTDLKAADGMIVGQGSGRMDNVPVMVSNGESVINARSTSMFKPLLSAINQAGGGRRFAAGGITGLSTQTSPETNLLNQISSMSMNTPIKTYVVSTDVSSSQSLDRQIKSRSVL